MLKFYLYDQPLSDAAHMGGTKDAAFLDLPATRRQALAHLVDGGGLRAGDTLVVSAGSKLGGGRAVGRIKKKLVALGVALRISGASPPATRPRGKRRPMTDAERAYCKTLWQSTTLASDALTAMENLLNFPIDRNWANYHLGPRDGLTISDK